MMEFHISRQARERYQFEGTLFSYTGNVVFANMAACRSFAHRMNTVREVEKHPESAVHAGQLYAMGLIDEASHVLMARYREQFDPEVMTSALDWFSAQVGAEALDKLLLTFVEQFPGASVIRGEQTPKQWLETETGGLPNRAAALEEMLLLWTANRNEAFRPFDELFEEKTLAEKTVYKQVTKQLPEYFATRPLIPVDGAAPMNLLDLLRAPSVGSPTSLSDQLALIRKLWKPLLGEGLERFLMLAGEILHEEELAIWMQFNPPAAQAHAAAEAAAQRRRESGQQQWPSIVSTAEVPTFGDPAHEYEKFSPDTAWMPNTVLIAKSTYVWLAQLSKKYGRRIARLDEIPDEELATLSRRGLNSLWLIGVVGAEPGIARRSSSFAGIRMLWHRRIRCLTIELPRTWAEKRRISTCAIGRIGMGSGWRATWCRIIWASIRPGWWSIRSGSFRGRNRHIRRTASMARIFRAMGE